MKFFQPKKAGSKAPDALYIYTQKASACIDGPDELVFVHSG
jgi:hypothetical protein